MKNLSVKFASWKHSIKGKEEHAVPTSPSKDIFSSSKNKDSDGRRKYPSEFT